jgi:hypothetical protein
MGSAHIGKGFNEVNPDDYFDCGNAIHINRKWMMFDFLYYSNGIHKPSDCSIITFSNSRLIVKISKDFLLAKFSLPFDVRYAEGFDCFLWTNRRWTKNLKKYEGNTIDNCRTFFRLEVNEEWFNNPRLKLDPMTTFYGYVIL